MMTRRDKLLNRPWQLRRYNNHRKKVLTALPAIDFGPPAERNHVTLKLKKLQWEGERRLRIEEENFKLLQRMGSIMRKNRLENHWETPPPSFLHRVGIYHRTRSPTPFKELEDSPTDMAISTKRKGCSACTPTDIKTPSIPEERVPWPPPRPRLSRRSSSTAAMRVKSDFDFVPIKKEVSSAKSKIMVSEDQEIKKILPKLPSFRQAKSADRSTIKESQLVLTQGALKLSVKFPSHAEVRLISNKENRCIQRSKCECKSIKSQSEDI